MSAVDPGESSRASFADRDTRLPRYGSPTRTGKLGASEETSHGLKLNFKPSVWEKNWFLRAINENLLVRTSAEQKYVLALQYTFLVNCFLRDRTIKEREDLVRHMVTTTINFARWEDRPGGAVYMHHPFLGRFLAGTQIERGETLPSVVFHEGIHQLQNEGFLPWNNVLTYEATHLAELVSGRENFVRRAPGEGAFYPYWLDRDRYFGLVHQGNPGRAFAGVVGEPEPDVQLFLTHEEEIQRELRKYDETGIPPMYGIKDVYNAMANCGLIRAFRAGAIGVVTNDFDHSWTVLYLHGRGWRFEEAEREVVDGIKSGDIAKYYKFPVLELKENLLK